MRERITVILFVFSLIFRLHSQAQAQQIPIPTDSIKLLIENYRFNEAVLLADNYLRYDSTNITLSLLKGKALAAGFLYKEATDAYLKAFQADSTNIQIIQELVNTYSNSGDLDNAILFAKKSLKVSPVNPFFRLQLANLFTSDKNFRQAVTTLQPLLSTVDSANFYVLKQLAASYFEMGIYDSAEIYYLKALTLVPKDARICQRLINVYVKSREYKKGVDIADRYLISDSTYTPILRLRSYCYYLLRDFEQAETGFRSCIIQGDESRFVLKYLGMSLYMREDYFESGRYFQKTFALDSTDAEIAYYIGVSLYKAGDVDKGLHYLQKALEMERPSTDFISTIYSEMAGAYNQHNQSDTALVLLQKAYSISPAKKNTLFRIAYQYDKYLSNKQQAIAYYKEYLSSNPENADLPIMVGNTMSFKQYAENRIKELKK